MENEFKENLISTKQIIEFLDIEKPTREQIIKIKKLTKLMDFRFIYPRTSLLTAREKECLSLVAQGKNMSEVADHLNVKKDTVRIYKKNIIRKMSCTNICECIFVATRKEVI